MQEDISIAPSKHEPKENLESKEASVTAGDSGGREELSLEVRTPWPSQPLSNAVRET
jgi:hypothetical protein